MNNSYLNNLYTHLNNNQSYLNYSYNTTQSSQSSQSYTGSQISQSLYDKLAHDFRKYS